MIVKQLWISPTNILKASLKNIKLRLADKCISNVTAYWQLIASLAVFWLSFVYFTCKIDYVWNLRLQKLGQKHWLCNKVPSLPPVRAPFGVKWSSKYLPNLLEFSLIIVCAFPKASIKGFTCQSKSPKSHFLSE